MPSRCCRGAQSDANSRSVGRHGHGVRSGGSRAACEAAVGRRAMRRAEGRTTGAMPTWPDRRAAAARRLRQRRAQLTSRAPTGTTPDSPLASPQAPSRRSWRRVLHWLCDRPAGMHPATRCSVPTLRARRPQCRLPWHRPRRGAAVAISEHRHPDGEQRFRCAPPLRVFPERSDRPRTHPRRRCEALKAHSPGTRSASPRRRAWPRSLPSVR